MKNSIYERATSYVTRNSNPAPVRPGRQNPRYGASTLAEYQLVYPGSAEVRTITQSGFVGPMIERLQRKAQRSARRRAKLERILTVAVEVWNWLGHSVDRPSSRPAAAHLPSPAPHHA